MRVGRADLSKNILRAFRDVDQYVAYLGKIRKLVSDANRKQRNGRLAAH